MGVQEVTSTTYSELVKFQCVMGRRNPDGSHRCATDAEAKEDNSFARATPSGKMELSIDNKEVHGFFKPGKSYYVDITEVPEPAAGN